MSSDQIRWEFAAADDFDAELSSEKAFNQGAHDLTDSAYRSLTTQLEGGSGTDQNLTLNRGHDQLYTEVQDGGNRAQSGISDMQEAHRAGMMRGLSRLQQPGV